MKFLIIYFLCFTFLTQQFIYTGCFLFPTSYSCLNVSWFNIEHLSLSKQLELINKSYSIARDIYSPEEYLNNFNWFSFWIKRSSVEIFEHLMTMILPVLFLISLLKKEKKEIFFFQKKMVLFIFVILSLIFWLNFSPVFRFGIFIFVTLIYLVFSNILITRIFSKNINRIINADDIFIGIQKIDNKYIFRGDISNEYAKIYHPDVENNKKNGWQGRLCWDTPFICSYNKLSIKKNNGYFIINKLQN